MLVRSSAILGLLVGCGAQPAAAVGRALVLDAPFPGARGRVLDPGQLERPPGGERDLDKPAGAAPVGVAVLALDAADQVERPADVVAGVLAAAAFTLVG